jgi:hypothetical protein
MKKAEVIFELDLNDKDLGEKKHSGRYVAVGDDPPAMNIYLSRSFVGPRGSTAKKVKATFEIIE